MQKSCFTYYCALFWISAVQVTVLQPSAKETTIKSLTNKTAFITGGASGIGLGMARAFAEQGMKLVLVDIDEEKLKDACQELENSGIKVKCFILDVTDKDALFDAVQEAIKIFGSINVVCANAGVSGTMGPLDKASVADWDWVIDVNVKGAVYLIQTCLPHLLKNPEETHITITSSISGLRVYQPSRGQAMYNTTKFALTGLGEALKVDLEKFGIGVSILCPGVVNTEISHSGRKRPDKYGGAMETNEDHDLAIAAANGTDPLQYGRWVVKAIEENLLYVITHPDDRELIEERHNRIINAFDNSTDLTAS